MNIDFNNHLQDLVSRINNLPQKQPPSPNIVILQVTEQLLPEAIQFQFQIRKQVNKPTQLFLLCDTNKSPCCTDLIGALHLGNYDLLVHFGQACFSEEIQSNQVYYFQKPRQKIDFKELREKITQLKVDTLIVHQSMYDGVEQTLDMKQVEVLKLPIDKQDGKHLALGYYTKRKPKIVMMLGFLEEQQQKLALMKDSIDIQKLFSGRTYQIIDLSPKLFMRRLYLINKVRDVQTFGILVKNASTKYCQQAIQVCKSILSSNDKKYYIFMMNNLNEVKLANFPEIQAYVIISCHNCSLYNESDMHKLVVTPHDIQAAFQQQNLSYQFDLGNLDIQSFKQKMINKNLDRTKISDSNSEQNSLVKQENQLDVQKIFQTLQYYKGRQYKGIDYSFSKQIKKMSKGKIGLAQQYKKLQ